MNHSCACNCTSTNELTVLASYAKVQHKEVKGLLHKHEDLDLDPNNRVKADHGNVDLLQLREVETGGFLGLIRQKVQLVGELQLSQKLVIEEDLWPTHTCAHEFIYACAYIYISLHVYHTSKKHMQSCTVYNTL